MNLEVNNQLPKCKQFQNFKKFVKITGFTWNIAFDKTPHEGGCLDDKQGKWQLNL